jgi:UPF0716 protein FxsA
VRLLFFVFVLLTLPAVELLLLVEIGQHIGTLATIGLIAGTGIGGLLLARLQGIGMLARLRRDLAEGRSPAGPIVDGALILVAAVALAVPGVLTDLVGMLLLAPAGRRLVTRFMTRRFERAIRRAEVGIAMSPPGGYDASGGPPMKNVTPRAPNDERR